MEKQNNYIDEELKNKIVGTLFNAQNSPKNYKLEEIADKIMKVVKQKLQEVEKRKVEEIIEMIKNKQNLVKDGGTEFNDGVEAGYRYILKSLQSK